MTYSPTDIYRDEADYEELTQSNKFWSPLLILVVLALATLLIMWR